MGSTRVLHDRSEPETDICVVRGSLRDYVNAHPTHPALVIRGPQNWLACGPRVEGSLRARGETVGADLLP
jgi:hypothetical protein